MDFFYGEVDSCDEEIKGYKNNNYNDNPEESLYIYGKLIKEVAGIEAVSYDGLATTTATTIIDNNDRTIKVNVNTDVIATKEYVDENGGKIDNILLNNVVQPIQDIVVGGVEYKKAVNLTNVATQTDLDNLENEINQSIDEINANLLVVNANITNINNDIEEIQGNISNLETLTETQGQDISDLQDSIQDISGDISGKLDKDTSVTEFAQAYVKNANGTQTLINLKDTDNTNGSIVIRGSDGNVLVPSSPTSNNAATSKTYVDTQVATKGSRIGMALNSSTYELTVTLYDANDNILGTTQTVDLPIESLVENGYYDDNTKSVILELENGQTITIPLGDLVDNLQTEITELNKLSADLVDDTNTINKFVTETQRTQIGTNQTNIATNTQDIADIKIDITNINNSIGNIENDIDSIQGDILGLQGDISDIETDISNITNGTTINNFSAVENALSDKQDTLIAGNNITIENNVISANGGSFDSVVLEDDLYTYASVGNITNATPLNPVKVGESGDSLTDIWEVLFGQKDEQPRIESLPSLNLSFSNYGGNSQEYGTHLTNLNYTLTKTTGAYTYDSVTGVSWVGNPIFTLNGTTLTYENNSLDIDYTVGTDTTFTINVSQNYSDGNIAKTLLGNDSNPIIKITGNTATTSRNLSITSLKYAYYGVTNTTNLPIDSNNKIALTKRNISGTNGSYTLNPNSQYLWIVTPTAINSITWNGNLLTEGANEDYTFRGTQTIKLDTNATTTYYFYIMNGSKTGSYTYVVS